MIITFNRMEYNKSIHAIEMKITQQLKVATLAEFDI